MVVCILTILSQGATFLNNGLAEILVLLGKKKKKIGDIFSDLQIQNNKF